MDDGMIQECVTQESTESTLAYVEHLLGKMSHPDQTPRQVANLRDEAATYVWYLRAKLANI